MRCGLSPGKYSSLNAQRRDRKRKWLKDRESTREFKLRRLKRKRLFQEKESASELREGDTYSPDVDMQEQPATAQVVIPPPPKCSGAKVFFDLETTGLGHKADIVQLSAVCNDQEFNRYILPNKPIHPNASDVTGITMRDGVLYHNNVAVNTVTIQDGLESFLEFVQSFATNDNKPVLIGHNIERFDVPILYNQLKNVNMSKSFSDAVSGCIDTLTLAKNLLSKKDLNLCNFKQSTLVKELLGKTYDAHNALADVKSLQELFEHDFVGKFCDADFSFVFHAHVLKDSLKELQEQKVLSAALCTRCARSGLGLKHLKTANDRDKEDGVQMLFSEPCGTGCRVTRQKKLIVKVHTFLNKQPV